MDLVIVGAGKLGEYIALNYTQFNLRHRLIGFVDDNPKFKHKKVAGLPVLGTIEDFLLDKRVCVIMALASCSEKMDMVQRLAPNPKIDYPNVFSSGSWISRECIVGKGNIILEGSLFNFGTLIGSFNSFERKCSIGHETIIGDFCCFKEEVQTGGYTYIEDGCQFGKGVIVNQGVRVGKHAQVKPEMEITDDVLPESNL